MDQYLLVSILIPSFNYGDFLKDSIDSALNQTYPHIEVVVIDDGSKDDSPQIIRSYGDQIVSLIKEKNEGCHACFNAGFELSKGSIVSFLDADDMLLPTAIEKAVESFSDPGIVKVYWPLWIIDRNGKNTGQLQPPPPLPEGDLRQMILENGPDYYGLTNQGAYPRSFLEEVFPIPGGAVLKSGYLDGYLSMTAPFFGRVKALEPLGCYRHHGENTYQGRLYEILPITVHDYEWKITQLIDFLKRMGIEVSKASWINKSWWHQVQRTVDDIEEIIPVGEAFILVDEDRWGFPEVVFGRSKISFPERNGLYWGPPPDSQAAIEELQRLRKIGFRYLVIASPAFWWLDHYKEWSKYLRQNALCMLKNDRVYVFDNGVIES